MLALTAIRRAGIKLVPPIQRMKVPRSVRLLSSSSSRYATYSRFPQPGGPRKPTEWTMDYKKWSLKMRLAAGGGVATVIFVLANIDQVEETGRYRFIAVTRVYEDNMASAMSDQLLQQFKGKVLPCNHPVTQRVESVTRKILDASGLGILRVQGSTPQAPKNFPVFGVEEDSGHPQSDRQWTLTVVNAPKVVNAMACPGNIIVFTGILPLTQDDEGLAAVIAHEIGHVVARHSAETMSMTYLLLMAAYITEAATGIQSGLVKAVSNLAFTLPHSRSMEIEADIIGIRLASKACFNPQAALGVQTRLGQLGGSGKSDFFNTHPSSEKRVKRLENELPKAYDMLAASPGCGVARTYFGGFLDAVDVSARSSGRSESYGHPGEEENTRVWR